MTIHKIYSLTSIGRPVDWNVPSNRTMVILLGPCVMLGLALALLQGASGSVAAVFALGTALAAFGAWALGREIDPDRQSAAFSALVVAVLVMAFGGPEGGHANLLVLFTTLGLVRQVNRTTGLEARIGDSLVLLALTLVVMYGTENPLFPLVAGISFMLDGVLERPLRRQWFFAILSFGATLVYMVDHDLNGALYSVPRSLPQWLAALAAVVFALNILLVRDVVSRADVGGRRLLASRVRGGMFVALLAVVLGLPEVREVGLIAATLAGVCFANALRRSFRNPA